MTSEQKASVFRAYDIRGLVDKDFNVDWVTRLGKACGTYFLSHDIRTVVVGRDCRLSSPAYHDAVIAGLISTGVDVVSVGEVGSPVFYFAVTHLKLSGGIMITASHNPSPYNGFKIWAGASTIYGDEIQKIKKIMDGGVFSKGEGLAGAHDIIPAYIDAVLERVKLHRPLKVVVDGGNGMGGDLAALLLERMGVNIIRQFCKPDGTFPNHHPDPVVEDNMRQLKERILSEGADLGIGLDGDADRIGVMDENGRLLYGDELLTLFARELLTRKPGATIIGEVKCSHLMYDDIEKHGGNPLMWITGHSFIKSKMREISAALAGEMSGHIFFSDNWFGFDDGIYGAARFIDIFSAQDKPLSALPGWPKTAKTPEIHLPCPDTIKFAVVEKARSHFREKYQVTEIDGVRVMLPHGWGLIRASNTQPALVLRFEAETEAQMNELRQQMETPLKKWITELGG